jgi:hypothetical protein
MALFLCGQIRLDMEIGVQWRNIVKVLLVCYYQFPVSVLHIIFAQLSTSPKGFYGVLKKIESGFNRKVIQRFRFGFECPFESDNYWNDSHDVEQ